MEWVSTFDRHFLKYLHCFLTVADKDSNAVQAFLKRCFIDKNVRRQTLYGIIKFLVTVSDTRDRGQPACHEDSKK